ncbi:MAG: hypothetical protein Kow00105_09960 [Phycisphaeraceae bacterium]
MTIPRPITQSAQLCVKALLVGAVFSLVTLAQAQADQPTLDELLDLTPSQPAVDSLEQPASETPSTDTSETLTESVTESLREADAADVFEQAVMEMGQVSRRLGRSFDPGIETQRMQESILRKLDQVIAAAKEQGQSGGSGSSGQAQSQDQGGQSLPRQGRPRAGSSPHPGGQQASTGQAGVTDPIDPETPDTAIEQLRREWGALPPRVRDELTDGLRERFSPLYRRITEAYYKALAEQESTE